MTKQPRRIEVFTAGCALCGETLQRVQQAVASCGCEVVERRISGDAEGRAAKDYGIRSLPSVVVDGQLIFEGRLSDAQAALLAR